MYYSINNKNAKDAYSRTHSAITNSEKVEKPYIYLLDIK